MTHGENTTISLLDDLAASTSARPLLAVRIELLDLAALKEKLGPRWEHSERTIRMLIEASLRKAVTGADRWHQVSDNQYTLFLANASEQVAQARCKALLENIVLKLFGAGDLAAAPRMTAGVLRLDDAAFHGSAAARLAAITASGAFYSVNSAQLSNADLSADTAARIAQEKDELTIIAAEDIDALVHQADKDTPTWQGEQSGLKPLAGNRPSQMADAAQQSAARKIASGISYSFSYTPIWDITRRALLCYRLNFLIKLPQGNLIDTTSSTFVEQYDRSTLRAIDMLRVKHALGGLMRSYRQGRKYLVSIPVSAQSCSSRWGVPTVFDVFSGLPKDFSKLVLLDLIDGARAEIRPAIDEIALRAAQFCRQALIRVDQKYQGGLLAAIGARPIGLGVDIARKGVSERHLMKFLDDLASETAGKDASAFVWGVNSRSIAMMAAASGMTYVSGETVAPDVTDPSGISKLTISEFFS